MGSGNYDDLNNTHNPATDTIAPATWGDQVRTNQEALFRPSMARVFHSSASTISTGTPTVLSFDSEAYDTDGFHSTVSNTDRLTIPVRGVYAIGCSGRWASGTGGVREIKILKNLSGTDELADIKLADVSAIGWAFTVHAELQATDFVRVEVTQATGGDLDVAAESAFSPYFWATFLGSVV